MKQIVIRLAPNGEIQAETQGIFGGECLNYLKLIEALTNAKVTDSEFTKEYLQTQAHIQTQESQEVSLS